MTIRITHDVMARAGSGVQSCPIAVALQDLGVENPRVYTTNVLVGLTTYYDLPEEAKLFIDTWDESGIGTPFEFEIPIPMPVEERELVLA